MRKKAICLVALGAAGVSTCQAQSSSVQIYGAVDAYLAKQSANGGLSRQVLNSGFNPNALGFTGTEDLGGGLKAGFRLEGQPSLDTGAFGQGGKPFGRQSLVFLSGDWGRVEVGRLHTAGRALSVKHSVTGWLSGDVAGNLAFAMGAGIVPAMNVDTVGSRLNNSIAYQSPNINGFNFSVQQSAAEGGSFSAGQVRASVVGVGYSSGPFSTDLAVSYFPEIVGSQVRQLDYQLGAIYDFKVAKAIVLFQGKNGSAVPSVGAVTPIAGSEGTDRLLAVGVQVPMTSGMLGISAGRMQIADNHRGRRPANMAAPFASTMDSATAWSVAYTHYLSKRTSLFASYSAMKNSAAGTGSFTPDLRPTPGGRSTLAAAGIRHSF